MTPDQSFIIELGWLLLWMVIALSAAVAIVGGIAFNRTDRGAGVSFSLLIRRGRLLEIVTSLTIVLVAGALAILDKVPGSAAIAIMSGIAGYVLGSFRGGSSETE